MTLQPTGLPNGLLAPIVGKTNGTQAVAGAVGEIISSTATSATGLTTIFANISNIILTPGNWDVSGLAQYSGTGGTDGKIAISTTTASSSGTVNGKSNIVFAVNAAAGIGSGTIIPFNVSITDTTTYYLNMAITGNTGGSNIGTVRAIRVS